MEEYGQGLARPQPTGSQPAVSLGVHNVPQTNQYATNHQPLGPSHPQVPPTYRQAPPPPPKELKTEDIEVEQPKNAIRYFIGTFAASIILASLFLAFYNASKASAASQYEAKYQNEVASILDSTEFKGQEESVQNIGSQVASLKTQLASRTLFSAFFAELERVMFKGTRLTRVATNKDGEVSLEGITGSFGDLAKTMDALQTSTYFSNITLTAVDKQQDGTVNFVATLSVDKRLLQSTSSEGATQ